MRAFLFLHVMLVGCSTSSQNQLDSAPPRTDARGSDTVDAADPDAGTTATVDVLRFAVVGDTRPFWPNDTANYPTDIITKVWQDIEAESPRPTFAVATGDYIHATTGSSEQQPQLDLYMQARAAFTGPMYPVFGNHECTGATASNCGPGTTDGETANYTAYLHTMLPPIGVTLPYYVESFAATDASWTAKLVIVACNAWTTVQSAWLETALARPTTYTFVARHEGVDATSAPCMAETTATIASYPLTMLIVGHTHTYRHDPASKQLVVGNGGAPINTGVNYGYVIIERNADGSLTTTAYDYASHAVVDHFMVKADGSPV